MKWLLKPTVVILLTGIVMFLSCKKEKLCAGCIEGNKPPIAVAGSDQVITSPTDSVLLDGSASSDPDGKISEWLWTKIAGPAFFNIANASSAKPVVKNLTGGIYQFELKVTDAGGLFSKDTMNVIVPRNTVCPPSNRAIVNAQLIPVGILSEARIGIAAVSSGNKIFFAGGINASSYSSRVDIYDITTQTWSIAELSIPRAEMTAIAAGDKIFFAGGRTSTDISARVDIYDLTTKSWSTAELSQARWKVVAAAVGNKVFFAGGYLSDRLANPISGKIDIYDITANTWSTASLSEARIELTATTADNKIYFAGGWNGMDRSTASNKIDIYDNITDSWSVSALTAPKAYMASIFKDGKIYWAGGATYIDWDNETVTTCEVEIKDINTQTSSLANNLFEPNGVNYALEKGNQIVFIPWGGGLEGPRSFDIYNVTTNGWSIGVLDHYYPLGIMFSADNTIYVAGGKSNDLLFNEVWKIEF